MVYNGNQESSIRLILSRIANYLPLAGGTMTGDITMGTNTIKMGTDVMLKGSGDIVAFQNWAGTDTKNLEAATVRAYYLSFTNIVQGKIQTGNGDTSNVLIEARTVGVGLTTIAKLCPAASPFLSISGALATLPLNTTLPAGHWVIGYVGGGNATLYVNDAGVIKSLILGAPA